jgi:hypothetical protein
MLSPSPPEVQVEPELKELAGSCKVHDFLSAATDWKADATANKDSVTIFYFVGHGLLLNGSAPVMLFEDFGDGVGPSLRSAVSVENLYYGLAPRSSQPNIARTQLFFIDTSRIQTNEFFSFQTANTTPVYDAERAGIDDRSAAIFYATTPGAPAYGIAHGQSIFSTALVKCLSGAAATPGETDEQGNTQWLVSISSLITGLQRVLADLAQELNVAQQLAVSGQVRDSIIGHLNAVPDVDLILELDPSDAFLFASFNIQDQNGVTVSRAGPPQGRGPFRLRVPAGIYTIDVNFAPDVQQFISCRRIRTVRPPRTVVRLKVNP